MLFFLYLTCFLSCYVCVQSHEDDKYTVQYTADTFPTEVPKKNHFVMFYAPWCGHCQRLGPTWEQLAEMLNEENSNVLIAKVDCTVDSTVCSDQDVTGYPTLKFFRKGEKDGIKFPGTRDLPSLSAFINEQLRTVEEREFVPVPEPTHGLVELTEDTFDKHVGTGKHFVKFYAPWCGHCQKLAPTWEQLAQALEFESGVSISKVDCTQYRSVCNQFDVKGYPTLLWIEDGEKIDKYQSERTLEDLKAYVNKMMGAEDTGPKIEKPETVSTNLVMTLTEDDFQHATEQGVVFVKFFAPWCGHCKRLAPTWEELAKKFQDKSDVHVAKVDCTVEVNKNLCNQEEVDGFPTMFLYKKGKKAAEYNGDRSLEDLEDFVLQHVEVHDEL